MAEWPKAADSRSALAGVPRFKSWPRHSIKGDKAWTRTLFNSGCRPGEICRLRVGDVVPHDEGYIELRVQRGKGSAPEPAPVYEDAVPA